MYMKETIIRKLTSRKFWVAVVGFVTAIIMVFKVESITAEQADILVMAFGTLMAYILGEGFTDIAHTRTDTTEGVDEDA
jgi:hypothetical protein